ncbi:LacI family DNA-binding transcriptional regulator [Arcanobacterium ihumii]|uniref:LacI family DNA-binding transcriptional regulator n=1 Tax=Arcanobacterium ihumii TaxID=2138162 RepID=UPI001359A6E0|nr:LacI family DNA-binding transcriptional regulator [Arcanobacterium ihumii]
MGRPTIKDIAKQAGVSSAAVSFALNNRPGISDATRERILRTAKEAGWVPNSVAIALSGSKAGAVGLIIARPESAYSNERFFFEFIVGLQRSLTEANLDLVFHTATNLDEELSMYRRWMAQGRVDGVVVIDPRVDDPRPDLLRKLGMPGVFVGAKHKDFGAVLADDAAMMTAIVDHLQVQGAKRLGYVAGNFALLHTQTRFAALRNRGKELGIDVVVAEDVDVSEASSYEAVEKLLTSKDAPDALVFDNEILALGGVQAVHRHHLAVGEDVLMVSCEDSDVCRVLNPPITAVRKSARLLGEHAGTVLSELLNKDECRVIVEENPRLEERESTMRSTILV